MTHSYTAVLEITEDILHARHHERIVAVIAGLQMSNGGFLCVSIKTELLFLFKER